MIKYGAFSEITGDRPMILFDDNDLAMDFCYSQNKGLYPKEFMVLSPLYCFIRKVEVNDKGDIIRIEKGRYKMKTIMATIVGFEAPE